MRRSQQHGAADRSADSLVREFFPAGLHGHGCPCSERFAECGRFDFCSLHDLSIPTGLRHPAQGCEGRATLGAFRRGFTTPTGLRPDPLLTAHYAATHSGLDSLPPFSQGSSVRAGQANLATLGFVPESLWDSASVWTWAEPCEARSGKGSVEWRASFWSAAMGPREGRRFGTGGDVACHAKAVTSQTPAPQPKTQAKSSAQGSQVSVWSAVGEGWGHTPLSDERLRTSTDMMSTGLRPDCSCPRVGSRSASQISPRSGLGVTSHRPRSFPSHRFPRSSCARHLDPLEARRMTRWSARGKPAGGELRSPGSRCFPRKSGFLEPVQPRLDELPG